MGYLYDLIIYENVYSNMNECYIGCFEDLYCYIEKSEYNKIKKETQKNEIECAYCFLENVFCKSLDNIVILKNSKKESFCFYLEKSNLIKISNVRKFKEKAGL